MPPRLSRAIAVFLIYLFAGPLFGALTFGILITIAMAFSQPGLGLTMLYASILLFPIAYLVGGIQAAAVGAAAALATWRRGAAPLWLPLGVALVAAGFHVARVHENASDSLILVAVHVVSASACWLAARRI
ncbi:MAG: hypothetical protein M9895_03585 [Aquamicrobium sp.]|uniref:hypothetical protein n=1 Tax=Aquamicrobium sp. TaxID=1872579 RepID=UPI00349ED839|nr:hypothetical protein [Aquamicrobium sp.]